MTRNFITYFILSVFILQRHRKYINSESGRGGKKSKIKLTRKEELTGQGRKQLFSTVFHTYELTEPRETTKPATIQKDLLFRNYSETHYDVCSYKTEECHK